MSIGAFQANQTGKNGGLILKHCEINSLTNLPILAVLWIDSQTDLEISWLPVPKMQCAVRLTCAMTNYITSEYCVFKLIQVIHFPGFTVRLCGSSAVATSC